MVNGSFESNFTSWTVGGDGYLTTDTGSGRSRHDYQTYYGWEGADVWFSSAAEQGSTYAVFGSQGNESSGSLTSSLWTATNQTLSFWHAGNNTSYSSDKAFAEILSSTGTVLGKISVAGQNDSVWRQYSFDLAALGLAAGDQFRFYYQDGESWSVIDNISESGAALASSGGSDVPEPASLALVGIGALMLAYRRRAR